MRFNKDECVVTNKYYEELFKGSRIIDNFHIWTPKSTLSTLYKKEDNDKLTKGSMCDAMLDHPAQHVVSEKERNGIDSCIHLLECQESHTQVIVNSL